MATVKLDMYNQCIEKINKQFGDIENNMQTFKNEIILLINAMKSEMEVEIKKLMGDFEILTKTMDTYEQRMDFIERERIAHNIVISGIPATNDTLPPKTYFGNICSAIGFTAVPEIDNIFRIISKNSSKNNSNSKYASPIIIGFKNGYEKSKLFKKYAEFGELKLSDIGIAMGSGIYCNDGFTKKNSIIFKMAKNLQKNGKILKAFTKRGQVHITTSQASQSVIIHKINQLNDYMKSTVDTGLPLSEITSDEVFEKLLPSQVEKIKSAVLLDKRNLRSTASTSQLSKT